MNDSELLSQPPRLALARKLQIGIWILTVLVLGLVGLMRQVKIPLPDGLDFKFLPPLYSTLNALVAVLLILALVLIKRRRVAAHRNAITAALIGSGLFLLCYVLYHFTTDETRYGGEGPLKYVYYSLLLSHVVLAAVSFPFILQTWMYGVTAQFDRHRRMARWVFPIWLYVAITGPICYLMLRPYY